VVSGFAAVWVGAARWIWYGRGAVCGVDVRVGAYSRDDSLSAHALSDASVAEPGSQAVLGQRS
jgi:hypothetical protein